VIECIPKTEIHSLRKLYRHCIASHDRGASTEVAKIIGMKQMRLNVLKAALAAVVCLVGATTANAQTTAKDLVGSWKLVSNILDRNGQKSDQFGPSPNGVLFFEPNGRYALVITRADLPKFPGDGRSSGTPENNKSVVLGSIGHFGTYSVEDNAIVFHVEHSTFPNWDGGTQKRPVTLKGEEMSFFVATASAGGGTSVVSWKRLP